MDDGTSSAVAAFAKRALAGAAAGALEACLTSPLETLKTRMKLGVARGGGQGVLRTAAQILREPAGFRGFYYGLPSVLLQASGKVAIRFSMYGFYSSTFAGVIASEGSDAHRFLSGVAAGASESLWIAPCERLKTLRVTQIRVAPPDQAFTTLAQSFSRLVLHGGGLPDLFVGLVPTAARNGFAVGVRFWCYDKVKRAVAESGGGRQSVSPSCSGRSRPLPASARASATTKWWHSLVAGCSVGVFTTVLSQPVDVVKSRMQGSRMGLHGGVVGTIRQMIREDGASAFGHGLSARLFKIGLGQGVIFCSYEAISSFVSGLVDAAAAPS